MLMGYANRFLRINIPAFSLLEISLVLLIMGILGAQIVPILKNTLHATRIERTKSHQQVVLKSISNFIYRNHRMPFAATPASNGQEVAQNSMGIVPYQTLGLDARYSRDGYGHYMTYAMNTAMGNTTSLTSNDENSLCFTPSAQDKALSITGYELPFGDFVALVLVAHAQGKGAITAMGRRTPMALPPSTQNNCRLLNVSDTGQFCLTPCGDECLWLSRHNLLSTYAGIQCKKNYESYAHNCDTTAEDDVIVLDDPSAA